MKSPPSIRSGTVDSLTKRELPGFAVIADAHFHDIESDYDFSGITIDGRRLTLRSWTDTRRSSRVFNESKLALKTTLNDIAQRGIKHVVLLGDYTDDGQIESTRRLVDLLRQYQQKFDLAFYAIPGNHDVYGPAGKHQSTRFATAPDETVLVTSSPDVAATENTSAVVTHKMYCQGSPTGLLPMADFGLLRQEQYLHWETPFGECDSVDSRQYNAYSADGQVVRKLFDASYLVEPVEGLWLLMIDANVFEPRNGQWKITQKKAFLDSSNAGWNSVLRNKSFLLTWIDDVCSRAAQLGKSLFSFSHYPIIDPFNDQNDDERTLFGNTETLKRTPSNEVATTLSDAGMRLHFGGHMHANGSMQRTINNRGITDIAVPSLVAFPACYKLVQPASDSCTIDTVAISHMSMDPVLMKYYRDEASLIDAQTELALVASNYGEFLYGRMYSRVLHHFLIKEWPVALAGTVSKTTVADLVYFLLSQQATHQQIDFGPMPESARQAFQTALDHKLNSHSSQYKMTLAQLADCSMMTLIVDWYCLKQAEHQAVSFIGAQRLELYESLAVIFGDSSPVQSTADVTFFSVFFNLFGVYLQRAKPHHVQVDSDTLFVPM